MISDLYDAKRAEIERIVSVEELFEIQPPNLFHQKTRKVARRTCCACKAPKDREREREREKRSQRLAKE